MADTESHERAPRPIKRDWMGIAVSTEPRNPHLTAITRAGVAFAVLGVILVILCGNISASWATGGAVALIVSGAAACSLAVVCWIAVTVVRAAGWKAPKD